MIEKLTIDNLVKYDFSKDHIEEIMKQGNYESDCTTDKGQFFVSRIEKQIYSDKEYFAKRPDVQMHFPHHNNDLFKEYYNIKLRLYLKKKGSNPGKNFNEQKNKERFKEEEIELIEGIIKDYKKQKPLVALRVSEKIDSYQNYLDWLNDLDETLQKINLSSIFNKKNNAFEVCKGLLDDLEITIDGIPNTKRGKVVKLTGLITAIKNIPGMLRLDRPTDQLLLTYFNSYLKTKYKTFSKRNEDYKESIDTSNRYLKQNFKK